jgi:hypothetical protein
MKEITSNKTELTMDQMNEIIKYCGQCAKLDLARFRCFARTKFYFQTGQNNCKAEEVNVHRWEKQLTDMIKYALDNQFPVSPEVIRELERVQKVQGKQLDSDIKRVYWEDVNRKDRKFGGGEKKERAISVKNKLKDNRLVIGYDERRREEERINKLCSKVRRKRT